MPKDRDFIIWGGRGHALVLSELLASYSARIVIVFDSDPEAGSEFGSRMLGGVSAFDDWRRSVNPKDYEGAVAIGGTRGRDRLAYLDMFTKAGVCTPPLIHPTAVIAPSVEVGAGSQVLTMAVIITGTKIGRGVIINTRASVDHECRIGDGAHIAPGATLCGLVSVGPNTLIGAGSVVLPRIQVGSDAVVGAGSVVTRDVPDGSQVAGNPARSLTSA